MATTIQLVKYSDKAVALFGGTKDVKDKLPAFNGRFNKYLTNPATGKKEAGWIFSAKQQTALQAFVAKHNETATDDQPACIHTANMVQAQEESLFDSQWERMR